MCAGAAEIGNQINCPVDLAECNQGCAMFLTDYPLCAGPYFALTDCALAAPLSSWSCDPNNGLTISASACMTQFDALAQCL